MSFVINAKPEFAYVVLGVLGILVHYTRTSLLCNDARKRYNVPYPDMGSGIFAAKLSEKDWIAFNNVQRAHYQYLEQLPTAISLAVLAGLYRPQLSAVMCLTYVLGRELYSHGYIKHGSSGRFNGIALITPSLFTWLGIAAFGSAQQIGWI
ncbi:hypothetical protein BC828DRAFT_383669 [Blastocladiella britannica]|nr:hypothetical protein BC828DRAFT_383669 [Blastocladiella britannica]